jgi:hypothetical protein
VSSPAHFVSVNHDQVLSVRSSSDSPLPCPVV